MTASADDPRSRTPTAVSSSSCVQDAVDAAGGTLEWTVVGSPIVARDMIKRGAVFVRWILIAVVAVSAVELLGVFDLIGRLV